MCRCLKGATLADVDGTDGKAGMSHGTVHSAAVNKASLTELLLCSIVFILPLVSEPSEHSHCCHTVCLSILSFNPCLSFPSSSQAELQQLEESLYKERKERERVIASYRKKVEERKAQAEKMDKKVRHTRWKQDAL